MVWVLKVHFQLLHIAKSCLWNEDDNKKCIQTLLEVSFYRLIFTITSYFLFTFLHCIFKYYCWSFSFSFFSTSYELSPASLSMSYVFVCLHVGHQQEHQEDRQESIKHSTKSFTLRLLFISMVQHYFPCLLRLALYFGLDAFSGLTSGSK